MLVPFSSAMEVVRDCGTLATAIGVIVAVWTLRANHDWNRRQYTAMLVANWNDKTSLHRKAIEKLLPGLIDLDSRGTPTELTKAKTESIYSAKPDSTEWELRFHFIELLNHFESIAAAYRNGVGDVQMIEESFRSVLVRYHAILSNFIALVNKHRGYEAWEPYLAVVKYWETKPFIKRKNTA